MKKGVEATLVMEVASKQIVGFYWGVDPSI